MPHMCLLCTLTNINETFLDKKIHLNVCHFLGHHFDYSNCQLPAQLDRCDFRQQPCKNVLLSPDTARQAHVEPHPGSTSVTNT